ncbi:hypothetical protein [Tenacibaculum sp. MAR_2010_89]|uniref:hypothetical protein n=1 Tax=Tenacibaculum sp. MAR_2010_89 TaxID=1250198 RepID=UPI0015A0624A|nr:hypothetical protein [Tenacibaculum sp. MAR_2010_89]
MKKSISNIGTPLNKEKQRTINGGGSGKCTFGSCQKHYCCINNRCVIGPFQEACPE